MKVAVLGAGVMGRTHANDLAKMPHIQLVGICDSQEKLATGLAERYGTKAYVSFEEMMEDAQPDVLSICLPTYLHKTYVVKAAQLGVHIICEKPLAPSLSEAREMIQICDRHGVQLFIAHVVRFFPNYQDMSRKIAADAIGKVGVAHARRVGGHPGRAKPWYKDHSRSGGVILDLMIHDIDYMRSVLGEVDSVYAMNRVTAEMDYALVTLRFRSGAIANLEGLWGYPGPFTTAVEFAGTKGVIRFNSQDAVSLQVRKAPSAEDASKAQVSVPRSPSFHDPYYYELEHFLACMAQNQPPLVSAEDGYKAMEIAFAAIASAKSGRPVSMRPSIAESGEMECAN